MSGGTFEYFCWKRDGDTINNIEHLEAMEKWCREQDYQDAADELYEYLLLLKTAQRRINKMAQRLENLMQTVEWECDGDYGEGASIEAAKKLLEDEG